MGTDTTFSAAVAAIVAHHAKLYNLLLAALPAYSGGKTPPRKERISHILNCEENDAHLLLERLATAAKAAPRGSLGEHPDILIAECRDFLDFLEEHLPSPDCAAAINETLQTEEAFVNFIKGISGADPRLSRRDYALRIDKFIRDIKASFRNLGSSIVKMEFTQFRFLQKPELDAHTVDSYPKCGADCFTQHDRVILNQIHKASVFGEMPTDSQVAGNIRRQQVIYGVKLYRPSSGKSKGFSSLKAADRAICAPQFKDAPGAYSAKERRSLAKSIIREYKSL